MNQHKDYYEALYLEQAKKSAEYESLYLQMKQLYLQQTSLVNEYKQLCEGYSEELKKLNTKIVYLKLKLRNFHVFQVESQTGYKIALGNHDFPTSNISTNHED